jgi:Glutaredoxin-like domain (DUF836)
MLTLLSRAYCHLCDDMREALAPLLAQYGATLDVRDVDGDPALAAAWGDLVPVLLSGGSDEPVEICHYHLDHARVEAVLRAAYNAGATTGAAAG